MVTGAGEGIGRAIVGAVAEEDGVVSATSRTEAKMADLPDCCPALRTLPLDVTEPAAVRAPAAEARPVDLRVSGDGRVTEGAGDERAGSWDDNSMGRAHIRAVPPTMVERRTGSIVNVASVARRVTDVRHRAAYGASRAAVVGPTMAVSRDFIGDGVRRTALGSGTTDSPSHEERMQPAADPEAPRVSSAAMRRPGEAREVETTAIRMAADEAGLLPGQIVVLDGGQAL